MFSTIVTRKHWAKLVGLLLVLLLMIWVGVEFLMPDDCESKYHRLKIGMTESEVSSEMARKNVLRHLVTKGQRLRRASGVTSLWTEQWYERDGKLVGVHFQWDGNGKLASKKMT